MPKVQVNGKLINKVQIKENIFKFSVEAASIANQAKPGQFLEIKVNDQYEPYLRRPISIYNIDKEKGIVEFIFQVKGNGTDILSKKSVGDLVDVVGPLGGGTFDSKEYKNLAVIGGGIGIFPLHEFAKEAKEASKNVNTYIGFRNKEFVILEKEFEEVSTSLCLATDDGSYGKNGFAINFLKEDIEAGKIDSIYACGPAPMLRAVKKLAEEKNIPCQVSLEEKMGCGMGVCVGCVVKTAESSNENPSYVYVCKNGPVFDSKEVDF